MILVGIVRDAVPQSYLVPPTFNVMGQLQATPLAGCPTVLPKIPSRVCERSVNARACFAHACCLFTLYM